MSGSTDWNVTQFLIVCPSEGLPKLRCWPIVLTLNKALLKKKKRSGTSLLSASFSTWFEENVCHFMLHNQVSMPDYVYFLRYWAIFIV